jgi:Ca2+-binding EF-hand superfamily protein
MKSELESIPGFSTKKAFKKLDKEGRGFLDVNSFSDFILCG